MAIPRLYDDLLRAHLAGHRQMAFVAGARQVGKTTTCRALASADAYLTWDDRDDRRQFQAGARAVAERLGLDRAGPRVVVVFDELHKFGRWQTFLKGFFDLYEDRVRVLVTGSSRLDVFRRGGDSLTGRYFLFRMHPLSIGELVRPAPPSASEIRSPLAIPDRDFTALWRFGGFPEPFSKKSAAFHRRWRDLRREQLVREDIRDLTRVQELGQLDTLVTLLEERSGAQLVYSSLAGELGVAVETIRRWLDALEGFYLGFRVRPWFANVARSLRKEPKWYMFDWAVVVDEGARAETLVACHLLKAVHAWNDVGIGRYELRYLRDTAKREVDFVVVRDRKPWFLVEVKKSDTRLSPALAHFQDQLRAPHAFHAVLDLAHVDVDCFAYRTPTVVPVRTLLSQLV